MTPVGQGPAAWRARGGRPQWSEAFLREAYAAESAAALGRRLGCAASTVIAALRFYGIAVRKSGPYRADPVPAFWGFVDRDGGEDACWWWRGASGRYGFFTARGKTYGAHVFSWMIAHEGATVPRGLFVCHRCDHPKCVNPAHLFLGTPLENTRDMLAKGRRSQVERRKLLTAEQARAIWLAIANREASFTTLAQRYGVSIGTIQRVRERAVWGSATRDLPDIAPRPCVRRGRSEAA